MIISARHCNLNGPVRRQPRRVAVVGATAVVTLAAAVGGPAFAGTAAEPRAAAGPATTALPSAAAAPALPASIASLGDSITRGFNACGFYVDCTRRSWATGDDDDVNSHRLRLRRTGALRQQANLAESGARVAALAGQAAQAVERSADYVTLQIGANDACRTTESAMTSVADFRARVNAAFATLAGAENPPLVFVASIPNLKRLWSEGKGSRLARWAWSKFDVCPTMLADPQSNDKDDADRRDRVRDRVEAYNSALAAACADYGDRCRYDGGAVFRATFSLDHVSNWDHFHPNEDGQRLMARVTWDAGFFG